MALIAFLGGCGEESMPPRDFSAYLEEPTPMRLVEVMAAHPLPQRREILAKALDHADIGYDREPFAHPVYSGVNLIVEHGTAAPTLILAAHTDRVPEGPGANDNASCVAAFLQALQALRRAPPLSHLKVRFLFSDGEEWSLRGAKHHADNNDLSDVVGVVSFEMCGIGDAFGIWDVTGPALSSPLVAYLQKAGDNLGIYSGTHGVVPRFGSDHRVFSVKGIAAVGVTVLPRGDEERLRAYVEDPNSLRWLLNFFRPTIFRTYHTSADKAETVSAEAIDMSARLIVEIVRVIDAETAAKPLQS